MQQQRTIFLSDCDVWQKWICTTVEMTSSMVGERRSSKHFLGQTCFNKGHGHCLVVCCWLIPPQLSEPLWNHYIWEVCLSKSVRCMSEMRKSKVTGFTEGPSSSPWLCLTACHTTNTSEVEQIMQNSAPSAIFIWPSPMDYHFKHLTLFRKTLTTSSEAENAFQEFTELWSTDFGHRR